MTPGVPHSSPLVRYPGRAPVLPPRLFGSVGYYGIMAQYPCAVVERYMNFSKNVKGVHRYDIVDTRGRLSLTVPVSRPSGARGCHEVMVSAHGRWWEVHRTALESAYGRTPFFEFYIDRLAPLFAEPSLAEPEAISDLCARADKIVREIIGIDTVVVDDIYKADIEFQLFDLRRNIDECAAQLTEGLAYWQVRADRLGFVPGLSILDAIFNLGPETALLLASLPDAGSIL